MISFSNPFYSALALIGNLGSLAVLYLLLSAEFVAAAQVLVYAGAVMVMFLFVIAYLGGKADAPWTGGPRADVAAIVASAALLVEIVIVIAGQADGHLSQAAEITARSAARARSGSCSSPTSCSRSRSPRSSCSSPRSAA